MRWLAARRASARTSGFSLASRRACASVNFPRKAASTNPFVAGVFAVPGRMHHCIPAHERAHKSPILTFLGSALHCRRLICYVLHIPPAASGRLLFAGGRRWLRPRWGNRRGSFPASPYALLGKAETAKAIAAIQRPTGTLSIEGVSCKRCSSDTITSGPFAVSGPQGFSQERVTLRIVR